MKEVGDREYKEFIKGKKIAIVAHAASIVGSGLGPKIDSYDLVARINAGIPIPEELKPDVGTRCDILYSGIMFDVFENMKDPSSVIDLNVKFICRPLPFPSNHLIEKWYNPFKKVYKDVDVLVRISGDEPYGTYYRELNARTPNTGFAAIWDLMSSEVDEIAMYGYTFFYGGNYPQYKPHGLTEEKIVEKNTFSYEANGTAYHLINPQLRYFKKLMKRDSRIKIDDNLRQVLNKVN